jgi:hypothetical protein
MTIFVPALKLTGVAALPDLGVVLVSVFAAE